LGNDVEKIADEAIFYGCDDIHMVSHPELKTYLSRPYGKILANLCKEVRPEIFLIGATHLGRDLAGVVATRLGAGLTADCTELDIEEETGLLLMTRPTFGGNIMATIFCENRRPQMSTVRPRVMKMPAKDFSVKVIFFAMNSPRLRYPCPGNRSFIRCKRFRRKRYYRLSRHSDRGKGACDMAHFRC
jgi:electron transfer flavoprotein alpha subunit